MQGDLHEINSANNFNGSNHLQETVMEKNQSEANNEKKGSGIFFWIFIGINVAFAILFAIKFIWG
jgi:hypothetical protein